MADDKQAIRDLIATWMEASKKGDTATVLNLITDDAVFMVPGRAPFGREAFAVKSEDLKPSLVEDKSDIQEIEVIGDWAWCRTRLRVNVRMPDGIEKRQSGYTLTIFRKAGEKWQLARDANLLMPEAE